MTLFFENENDRVSLCSDQNKVAVLTGWPYGEVPLYHDSLYVKYIEDITRWREDMDFMFE